MRPGFDNGPVFRVFFNGPARRNIRPPRGVTFQNPLDSDVDHGGGDYSDIASRH